MLTSLESMRVVAARLEPIEIPFAFLGGAVICLLVDHPSLMEIRPTKDVDVIVEILTLIELYALEEQLRLAGFQHDISEGAPICRWLVDGCRLDVIPINSAPLGMNSNWFPEALHLANRMDLGKGCFAKVIAPPFFLATKLEAFKDRGKGDFYGSHDLEDIVTLLDGCTAIVREVSSAPEKVRCFIAEQFQGMFKESDFHDAFPGHLSAISGSRERAPLVMKRVAAIANLR